MRILVTGSRDWDRHARRAGRNQGSEAHGMSRDAAWKEIS